VKERNAKYLKTIKSTLIVQGKKKKERPGQILGKGEGGFEGKLEPDRKEGFP